ncbi:UDP-3-O-(3-hydroxymyristoyl)glucosamine N-acyltransferase [Pseudoprimorskyibacter insulae]|uniref:UDP-3-O-acylglucosamine N-acyltransferase n=1 Tax=Pseudoprimorskyibacter insulae TaxID=1695997 RepID=A0A2R8AWN1_9RHOB|nr:UDP-3-O-(3-hydroxymyristoyl)glucosamine N-acyltransferase [Pseudoprimorskyibacter insulae]SPF80451.1 UDP-3-O-acylglucosamine N-acyltransferase [Pseudoprimorskyibacter insulae]
MSHSLKQIAEALGLKAVGAFDIVIDSVAEPAQAGPNQLALAMKPEFAAMIPQGMAQAALLAEGADWQALGLKGAILSTRPRYAMAGLSGMVDPGQGYSGGIHPSAIIDPTAELGEGVSVGPFTVIGAGARIGAGSVIGPQCFIGWDAQIGAHAQLHTGVRIMARVEIGDRFIAHSGAVIGADGFSFVTPEPSGVEKARDSLGDQGEVAAQSWARIHSLGAVRIGHDVEIGANSCIDRGTVRSTRIGDGCKFDNQVQIGHNVVIGDHCLICAQVGVAGSTVIGNHVVLGGQTGVSDNLTIGDNVITGGGTKILAKVPAGRVMLGYPATKMDAQIETYKSLRRLPRLFRDVAQLQKSVSKLVGND